jgi:hypothetical protein
VIRRNPCRIKSAGPEKSPERAVLAIPQVFALADALGQLAKQQMTDSPAANKGKRGKATGTGRARRGPQAS